MAFIDTPKAALLYFNRSVHRLPGPDYLFVLCDLLILIDSRVSGRRPEGLTTCLTMLHVNTAY